MGLAMPKVSGNGGNKVDAASDEEDGSNVYHERQVKELCALHALNNLLQDESAFSQQDLDRICEQLSPTWKWWNPHRSMLGTGNYDVNIIMVALKNCGYDVVWFDKRRDASCLILDKIEGFILNAPSNYKLGGFIPLGLSRKHWYTVRKVNNCYYNLDSKLKKPTSIGDASSLLTYLQNQLSCKDKELLVVVKDGVEPYQSPHGAEADGEFDTVTRDTLVSNSVVQSPASGAPNIVSGAPSTVSGSSSAVSGSSNAVTSSSNAVTSSSNAVPGSSNTVPNSSNEVVSSLDVLSDSTNTNGRLSNNTAGNEMTSDKINDFPS